MRNSNLWTPKRRRPKGRKFLYHVRLTSLAMPEWAYEKQLPDFDRVPQECWLKRGDARYLAKLDREDGGEPVITKIQWRRCHVCKRIMLTVEADRARRKGRMGLDRPGPARACGPECMTDAQRRKRAR